jgi:hypothetical protein
MLDARAREGEAVNWPDTLAASRRHVHTTCNAPCHALLRRTLRRVTACDRIVETMKSDERVLVTELRRALCHLGIARRALDKPAPAKGEKQ